MKAISWTEYGPPEVLHLVDVEQPVPKDEEILIRVSAANVFPGDCELRRFQMHPSMWLPIRLYMGLFRPNNKRLGQELSGVVAAVGRKVTRFKAGDLVFGATDMRMGAYAEYVCLPDTCPVVSKPSGISHVQAATIAVGGSNALHFIRKAKLQPGDHILINGACGSIGTFAVQLAKLQGATVTAVDSAAKLDVLRSLGADHVIDYQQQDFTLNGVTYDVILDVIGKSPYRRSLACLASGGRYLLANHGLSVMLGGVLTSMLGRKQVISALAKTRTDDLDHLARLVVSGDLTPVVDKVFPLADTVQAHRYVESGTRTGHVVLSVDPQLEAAP